MKKTLLSAIIIASGFGAIAQQNKLNNSAKPTGSIQITEDIAASVASATTTIFTPPSFAPAASCSLTTAYSVTGSSVGIGGFVVGNNIYGDKEKAMMYTLSSNGLYLPATVGQVYLYVGAKKAGGPGTGLMSVKIYADNAGNPGALLGTSVTRSISTLAAASYTPNGFTFTTPVALTTNAFFVSVDFTAAGMDTLSLVSTVSSTTTPCAATNSLSAWDRDMNNVFAPMKSTWNLTLDLGIFPVVTAETTTGVKNATLNTSNVFVSPNPSNGLVNISLASKNNENLSVSVLNALGQVIISNNYASISNDTLSLDLSNQNNGIYFISITNGQDKVVKRVVLNK